MIERVPRSTGEILSDGIGLLRARFRTFYLLALPFCAAELMLREGGSTVMQTARASMSDGAIDADVLLRVAASLSVGVGLIMVAFIVQVALSAGVVQLASDAWNNAPPTFASGLRTMTSRAAWLALTTLLFSFAFLIWMIPSLFAVVGAVVLFGLAAQIISMVLMLVWTLLGFVVLTLRWGLFTQTVVLEDKAGPSALGRSRELLAGRGMPFFQSARWRLSVLLLVSLAVSGTIQSTFGVPRIIYALTSGWDLTQGLPPLLSMPLYFVVPLALIEVALNAIVVAFGPVLLTLFFYDLRVRYEGLDLEPPAAPAAPAAPESGA